MCELMRAMKLDRTKAKERRGYKHAGHDAAHKQKWNPINPADKQLAENEEIQRFDKSCARPPAASYKEQGDRTSHLLVPIAHVQLMSAIRQRRTVLLRLWQEFPPQHRGGWVLR